MPSIQALPKMLLAMRPFLLATTLLAALLLAACIVEEDSAATRDIVSTIPWPDDERAEYVLLDRDNGEERGRGVLSATRQDGTLELRLRYSDERDSDESVVLVDALTLKPISVHREITSEAVVVTGEYDSAESIVRITTIDKDGDERPVPLSLEEHYYDNESSLFLWRTIPFEEGYEASYYSVLTNQRGQTLVTVRVVEREEVTVPAGTFQTWRVEIRFGGTRQVVWYADTPERALVQYDNTRQIMQLTP